MPRLRATSISSLVSIVNVTSPSTSAGAEPGVVERGLHGLARELQLGAPRLLRELGLADAGDRGAARQPAVHGCAPERQRERCRAAHVLAEVVHRAQLHVDDADVTVAAAARSPSP